MRVLIDATSVLLRSAGIKSYTYHWISHLRRVATDDEILAFPFLKDLGDLWHERSVLGPVATYGRLALLYGANLFGSPVLERALQNADVFHASNQVRKPPRKIALTATIHDMTCWLMPELHTPGNVRADRNFAEHVLKRARRLIAVSDNSRRDAIRMLGIPPERIEVIYSGVADEYFDAKPVPRERPYVLFVGTLEPRKNVDRLLDAWHLLRADLRDAFDLVVVGATGWKSEHTVARLRSGIAGIEYRGYVPEAELPALTAGATVFAYPSLYEGFGFPMAQAMAAGVPVLAGNNSCLPEIAGEGAVLADANSAAEICSGLERLLSSAELRRTAGAAGRQRAELYRWDTCARRSLEFFRAAVG